MRFQIKKVEPDGFRVGAGFVTRREVVNGVEQNRCCGVEMLTSETYPDHPGGPLLREARVKGRTHVTLGRGAARLGLTAEQLSGLEHGRYTFVDDDWGEAAKVLRGEYRRRPDGWPICPMCNEDELGCLEANESIAGNMVAYLKLELFCYRCAHTYPPGTFSAVEVET